MQTSGTSGLPFASRALAISRLVRRFSFPSVRSTPIGSCEPVRMTGLLNPSNIKLRADAVYAIVSVPCRITKPVYLS